MKKTRIEHYIDSLENAKTDDAKKGVLIVLLAEYSRSIVSRINNNESKIIMEWLDEQI